MPQKRKIWQKTLLVYHLTHRKYHSQQLASLSEEVYSKFKKREEEEEDCLKESTNFVKNVAFRFTYRLSIFNSQKKAKSYLRTYLNVCITCRVGKLANRYSAVMEAESLKNE